MAKKKLSPLVQAMNLFAQLDERDRQTLADYVRSQTATPRKKSVKKVDTSGTGASLLTGIAKSGSHNAA
jgi:mono/diheme cytochrome c family protein